MRVIRAGSCYLDDGAGLNGGVLVNGVPAKGIRVCLTGLAAGNSIAPLSNGTYAAVTGIVSVSDVSGPLRAQIRPRNPTRPPPPPSPPPSATVRACSAPAVVIALRRVPPLAHHRHRPLLIPWCWQRLRQHRQRQPARLLAHPLTHACKKLKKTS